MCDSAVAAKRFSGDEDSPRTPRKKVPTEPQKCAGDGPNSDVCLEEQEGSKDSAGSPDGGTQKWKQCEFLVKKKNRQCRMKAINGYSFCGEHLLHSGEKNAAHDRIPCPLDPSHTCYSSQLQQHLKKCNAREKPMPVYCVKNINGDDLSPVDKKVTVHTVSDDQLLAFIERIETLFTEHVSAEVEFRGCHKLVEEELKTFKDCSMVEKHLGQQGTLLKILEEKGLLKENQLFVEFGAGRGQLSTWVMRGLGSEDAVLNSTFALIDRAAQRYKADNRFVGDWGSSIVRIRADIRHLCIPQLERYKDHGGNVVGFCKHLCGAATDLALRCITSPTLKAEKLPRGVVMATCCHHRCEWDWFCGKEWLEGLGFTGDDFQLMVSIAGWATCAAQDNKVGTHKPRKNETKPQEDKPSEDPTTVKPNRYQGLGLKAERRKQVGYLVKFIFDEGRCRYLRSKGMTAQRVNFVPASVTLENYAIVAVSPQ